MSRNPDDLNPDILPKYRAFLSACGREQIDVLTTCTWRSPEEQAELYAQGRTQPGHIVTNAPPGESKHNFRFPSGAPAAKAFDIVPLRNGKPVWGTEGEDGALWNRLGELGEACGLTWAGRWTTFREYPHFEIA